MLGVVPSLVKRWRATGVIDDAYWPKLRCFGSTGECSNADDYAWLMEQAGHRPVIEYCGWTEIGGAYITGSLLQPQAPATFSTPAIGLDLVLHDEDGNDADTGEVFLVPPSIGLSQRLLNRDHDAVYYENVPPPLRRHGDQLTRLPGGYYRAQGRADDTMNLGGIKTSSAEIERALAGVEGIRDVAAIAVSPPGGGPSELVLAIVPESDATEADLLETSRKAIKSGLNPLFHVARVAFVDALPRTASNKVMRRVLRDRLAG